MLISRARLAIELHAIAVVFLVVACITVYVAVVCSPHFCVTQAAAEPTAAHASSTVLFACALLALLVFYSCRCSPCVATQ